MDQKKIFQVISLFVLFIEASFAAEDYSVYVLEKNDTISEILQKKTGEKLYGKDGIVSKTLKMNKMSKEDAFKLGQGRSILLPIGKSKESNNTLIGASSRKDSFSFKEIQEKASLGKNESHFRIYGDYFIRNTNLKNDYSIKSFQNFGAGFSYAGQEINYKKIPFRLMAGAYVYTQNNVRFEEDHTLNASLRPSFKLKIGVQVFVKRPSLNLSFFNEFQRLSLIVKNNDRYSVSRKSLNFFGMGMGYKKMIFNREWAAHLNLSYNLNDAWKYDLSFGTELNQDFDIKIFYESLRDGLELMDEVQSSGIRLVYKL